MQFLVSQKKMTLTEKKKKEDQNPKQNRSREEEASMAVIYYLNHYYQERLIDLYDTYNNADNTSLLGPLLEFQSEICSVVVDGRQLRMQSPNDAAVRANNASFLVGR